MKNTRQEIENTLKELCEQVREKMKNSYALDFVNETIATDSAYFSDSFSEFADNNTSIYYSEQREYFNENTSECEDALLELYDSETIADIIKNEGLDSLVCKAGALGEYMAIERELYENEDDIKRALIIDYLLDNLDCVDIDNCNCEGLREFIDNLDCVDMSRIDELIDEAKAAKVLIDESED